MMCDWLGKDFNSWYIAINRNFQKKFREQQNLFIGGTRKKMQNLSGI